MKNRFWKILFAIVIVLIGIVSLLVLLCKSNGAKADVTNKSLDRQDEYIQETTSLNTQKIFHLSIDDFIFAFKDITEHEKEYDSIFDNATFKWFKELHDNYGVVISCYVYYETEGFDLSMCTHKFKTEFEENSDWLRFGFHTANGDTEYGGLTLRNEIVKDYNNIINCLVNIVSESAIDNVVRVHCFSGSEEQILALKNSVTQQPVIGLLTADDSRQSYYLEEELNKYIFIHDIYFDESNDIYFISTDLRLEYIDSIRKKIEEFESASWYNQLNYLDVFTHEWAIDRYVKRNAIELCEYAKSNEYRFVFYEDVIKTR